MAIQVGLSSELLVAVVALVLRNDTTVVVAVLVNRIGATARNDIVLFTLLFDLFTIDFGRTSFCNWSWI